MARVAILGAMTQEINAYSSRLVNGSYGHIITVREVGIGKVNAAATTAALIREFGPTYIIFSGVGGSLSPDLKIGDIGIGVAAIDADVDVRRWDANYKLGQLPFSKSRLYLSDSRLVEAALSYPVNDSLQTFPAYIATADRFLDKKSKEAFNRDKAKSFRERIGKSDCVPNVCDMESSAVLQVASRFRIPSLVIRAISDSLEGDSVSDFNRFMQQAIEHYVPIVDHLLSVDLGRSNC